MNIKRVPVLEQSGASGGTGTPGLDLLEQAVIHLGQAAKKNASAFKELASRAQALSGQFGQLVGSMDFLTSGAAARQLKASVDRFSGVSTRAPSAGVVVLDVVDEGGNVEVKYAARTAEDLLRGGANRRDGSLQIRLALGWKAGMVQVQ